MSRLIVPAYAPPPGAFVDPACPIKWSHPLNQGLVAEWAVIPNAGWSGGLTFRDLVCGGHRPNDGTLTNMAFPPTTTSGWNGPKSRPGGYGCVAFDGSNDAVTLTPLTALNGKLLSVGAWFKTSFSGAVAHVCTHDNSAGGDRIWQLQISATGKLTGVVFNSSATTGVPVSSKSVNDGIWHRAVMTWDGTTVRLYIDGVLDGTASLSGILASATTNNAFIGRAETASPGYFSGAIDDVSIWNRGLSAVDLWADYQESKAANPNRWNWIGGGEDVWAVASGGGDTPITAGAGSLTFTGAQASTQQNNLDTPTAGALSLIGSQASLSQGSVRAAGNGTLTLTGAQAALLQNSNVGVGNGALSLTGAQAALISALNMTPTAAALLLTGGQAGVGTAGNASPSAGALVLAGSTPGLLQNTFLAPGSASLAFTGGQAGAGVAGGISPDAGSLVFVGSQVGVGASQSAAPTAGALMIAGTLVILANSGATAPVKVTTSGGFRNVLSRSGGFKDGVAKSGDKL